MKIKQTIYWCASARTKDCFYTEISDHLNIIDHDKIRFKGSKGWFRTQCLRLNHLLSRASVDGILIDHTGGLWPLILALISTIRGVPLYIRVRGGMGGEPYDLATDLPRFLADIIAYGMTLKRKWILSVAVIIFPVSYYGKSQILCDTRTIKPKKIKVVWKPVDFSFLDSSIAGTFRKKINLTEEQKVFLTSTSFACVRKYEAILNSIDVFVKILRKNPDWIYCILGGGHDLQIFKEKIMSKIPVDLNSRVKIIGYYDDMFGALLDANIFIYQSFRDMAPQVVKEAQSCSLPVLVNRTCFGANEFIPPSLHNDLIYNDEKDLLEKVHRLVNSPELCYELGSKNLQWSRSMYDKKRLVKKMVDCIANEKGTDVNN